MLCVNIPTAGQSPTAGDEVQQLFLLNVPKNKMVNIKQLAVGDKV